MDTVPSLLFCVGKESYKLHEFIEEAEAQGTSKRIPANAIPQGLVKGKSKLFFAHPDAIVKVTAPSKNLTNLAYDLLTHEVLSFEQWQEMVDLGQPYWTGADLKPGDFVPDGMLVITTALSRLEDGEREEMVERYGLKSCMGVFGWSYFTGFEYICGSKETGLPGELAHLEGYVEPVHVVYKEDEENTDEQL